jgi:hypothetical protein
MRVDSPATFRFALYEKPNFCNESGVVLPKIQERSWLIIQASPFNFLQLGQELSLSFSS